MRLWPISLALLVWGGSAAWSAAIERAPEPALPSLAEPLPLVEAAGAPAPALVAPAAPAAQALPEAPSAPAAPQAAAALAAAAARLVRAPEQPQAAVDALFLGQSRPEAAESSAVGESGPALFEVVERDGRSFLSLGPRDLGKDFLVSATLERGLGEKDFPSTRSDSLQFLASFRRVGDFVELVSKNTKFRAEAGTPLSATVSRVAPDSAVSKARARKVEGGRILVALDELFARDIFNWQDALGEAYEGRYGLDSSSSRVERAKSYPRNVELTARLSFQRERSYGQPATHLTDVRNLPLVLRYSLSALPAEGYLPRPADERVGFFSTAYQDWSDDQAPSIDRRVINRWRLEKQDPSAAVSLVKNPIVYWIDSSVPEQYRDAIERGILAWNKAFARAGFKNAIVVKRAQPGQGFDPADARYNVIRYYLERDSSYAIGPSRVNPLTGEIYNAGVAISAYHARSPLAGRVPTLDLDAPEQARKAGAKERALCRYEAQAAQEAAFTLEILQARGQLTEELRKRFIEDYMTDLTMHEVGHTLGLRHNFVAKSWLPNSRLPFHSPIAASVMDYAPINLAPPGVKQGDFWMKDIGPYDYWAIEYGYKDLPKGTEAAELDKIAARSNRPALRYMTDEDVTGLDPSAQPWSLGKDPIEFSRGRAALVRELWDLLAKKASDDAVPAPELYAPLVRGWAMYRGACEIAAGYIGGIRFRRGASGVPAYQPIEAGHQREALRFLNASVFSDEPLALSPVLLAAVAPERLPTAMGDAPDLDYLPYNKLVLWLRRGVLDKLLAPKTLERIVESRNLLPAGSDAFTIEELFKGLEASAFSGLSSRRQRGKRTLSPLRRDLQMELVDRLIDIGLPRSGPELPQASIVSRTNLRRLAARLREAARAKTWDDSSREFLRELAHKIQRALDRYEP